MIVDSNAIIYSADPKYNNLRAYLKKHETELQISQITKVGVLGYH